MTGVYVISKDFAFSASHQLDHLPKTHQCARLHGHNYVLRVELTHEDLNNDAFVMDYGELSPVKKWVDDTLDHQHLNDRLPFPTTAENMARFVWQQVDNLVLLPAGTRVAVGVSETPKTWAWFRP